MTFRHHIEAVREQLQNSGHHVVWHTVGTQLAHGTCQRCGQSFWVESSRGHYADHTTILKQPCLKKAKVSQQPRSFPSLAATSGRVSTPK